jgi:hypothetical protein
MGLEGTRIEVEGPKEQKGDGPGRTKGWGR